MGDNSVDMIRPALDNGEPNSTMTNQIVYSRKETILRRLFFANKWCHHNAKLDGVRLYCLNLLWCFVFTVNSKGLLYQFQQCLIVSTNQCKPKRKRLNHDLHQYQ